MSASKSQGRPAIPAWQTLVAQRPGVEEMLDAKRIALDLIDPNPRQPRTEFADAGLQELAASIRERGVLQPIKVRPVGERYELVAGERRWRAARLAGLDDIPAIITDISPDESAMESLIENLQRENLNPVDRANGLQLLRQTLGVSSWAEVGQRLGFTERRVFQILDIARLPESVQQVVREGGLSEKQTRALKGLAPERQEDLARVIHAEGLTHEQSARAARLMKADPALTAVHVAAHVRARPGAPSLSPSSMEPERRSPEPPEAGTGTGAVTGSYGPTGAATVEMLTGLAAQVEDVPLPRTRAQRDLARVQWQRIRSAADAALAQLMPAREQD